MDSDPIPVESSGSASVSKSSRTISTEAPVSPSRRMTSSATAELSAISAVSPMTSGMKATSIWAAIASDRSKNSRAMKRLASASSIWAYQLPSSAQACSRATASAIMSGA
jgi:hypothetical protein